MCNYYNGKVKAPHIIWFMFRWLMTKKKYKGASDAPPHRNRVNEFEQIKQSWVYRAKSLKSTLLPPGAENFQIALLNALLEGTE